MGTRIIVIERDRKTRQEIVDLLCNAGHAVVVASDGQAGLRQVLTEHFDMLLLVGHAPGVEGFEVCHAARQNGFDGGILMLNSRTVAEDRVKGLDAGADDYLTKPCDPAEFLARVNALLRRLGKTPPEPVLSYRFGSVTVEFETRQVLRQGVPVNLAAKEMQLLRYLIEHRGQILSREELLANVWCEQKFITLRTVDVHMAWLRQKLEDRPQTPRYLLTVRGSGYRFQPDIGPRDREPADTHGDSRIPSAREIAAMLDTAVNSSQTPVVLVGREGRFRFANRAASELLGYSRRELLHLTVRDLDPKLCEAEWELSWSEIKRAARVVFEGCWRTRNGSMLPLEFRHNHFRFGDDEYLLTLMHNLAGREAKKPDAPEPEDRLRNLIHHLPDSIVRFDALGRMVSTNSTLPKLLGRPPRDLVGRTLVETSPPANEAESRRLDDLVRRAIAEDAPNCTEAVWITPARTRRIYQVRHIPERDESGLVIGVLGMGQDITEYRTGSWDPDADGQTTGL